MTQKYLEDVMNYLEYLDYPYYVQEFYPEDVSRSMAMCAKCMYENGCSARMCALVIFGCTWHYQVSRTNNLTIQQQTLFSKRQLTRENENVKLP